MSKKYQEIPSVESLTSNKSSKKFAPVLLVLAVTFLLALLMIILKPKEQKKDLAKVVPTVEVVQVQPIDYVIPIQSEGVVFPKTKINIAAEVSGKITFISDNFTNGDRFSQGDVLLKIDPKDYELAITRAKANVAAQRANLDLQQAKSDLAKSDWKKYGKKDEPNALNLNLPQVASAKAALDGAKADLQLAQRNLEKTLITAPFDGVILAKMTDLGQFITLGTPLVSVASTEVAELRISLSDEQLHQSGLEKFDGAQNIKAKITSEEIPNVQWLGKISSIEAQRDAKTLFNYAVVEIDRPFSQQDVPLRFNTFVTARMNGETLPQVYLIERGNIMQNNKVRVLSPVSTLMYKDVEIVYTDEKYKYINKGINSNDKIIITSLSNIKLGDELKLAE
jgi:RND family efflux transporter MFP subunit